MFGHSEHCNAMRGNPHLKNASNIKGIAPQEHFFASLRAPRQRARWLAMTRKTEQLEK